VQNPGLELKTIREAPPEDAPENEQCTSPTQAYKQQKNQLQWLPPKPFIQPEIPKLAEDSQSALPTQPHEPQDDLQVSSRTIQDPITTARTSLLSKHDTTNEIENPTPQLRSRRARPIHVKRDPDMLYY